ncbi:MAG: tetratricopeptide repeat protein [Treponema sp.]|nr:tetratricopeptide repeat protein [Treponema sp.]
MADNVVSLEKKKEAAGTQQKVENFILKNRKPLLCIIALLVVAAVAVSVIFCVLDAGRKTGLKAIDAIENEYTKNNDSLSDSEVSARQEAALKELDQYLSNKNIVGIRASMLAADIYFARKNYEDSLTNWVNAASYGEKSYTAPICYYNAAVCCDELGKFDESVSYYEKAASVKDFYLASHACFNIGRIKESNGDFKAAVEAYQKTVDSHSGDDYAKLAQSRIIALRAEGKAE